jgi:hypothetical protein
LYGRPLTILPRRSSMAACITRLSSRGCWPLGPRASGMVSLASALLMPPGLLMRCWRPRDSSLLVETPAHARTRARSSDKSPEEDHLTKAVCSGRMLLLRPKNTTVRPSNLAHRKPQALGELMS